MKPEPPTGTVLIVDDHPTNIGLLLDYLSDSGLKVLVAQDGLGALELVDYASPDIILLDVMMPGLDGFETCRRLKQKQATHDIPVIFMTALSETVDKVTGFNIGAVDYITKPIQHEEVLARITAHLTIRNLQQNLEAKNNLLAEEIAERQKLIEELDAFAHTVAHDLKNPLSCVIAHTEAMDEPWITPEESKKARQAVLEGGYKMKSIIESLLLLARTRQAEVELYPLDMGHIVNQVRQRLAVMLADSQAQLSLPNRWPIALGHELWIEEVWANYVENAVNYGGQPPRLELGAEPQPDGMIRFWIRDNGPGLSPEAQSRLFTPFTKLSQTPSPGYGLGLSIVQRIIDKLGGQVGVTSDGIPGHGSVFSFTLPAADEHSNR
ncbi:MAG: hybrid sensor histidine kinase/response regulator [Anaerolineales bacterium]|nr:hybrid sensor histidine kinase/response regulator [Anaerolineales bacterium]MCB9106976.1 hybrid sensor histidine kinase/response regulator [Anaerolineales bacterium]